jgi:GT2 family glycosyltransferase/phage pi2 protein 07
MSKSNLALLYANETSEISHQEKVSVVIVTYNKYLYVRDLILSFAHLNYPRNLLDIVVVDNASVDGTEEKLKTEFGNSIHIIQTGANLGGAGGFNTGMKYVMEKHEADYIWLLDNDVVIQKNSLNELLSTIKSEENVMAVGSMILQLENPEVINEVGANLNWWAGKISLNEHAKNFHELENKAAREVEYCAAASLLKKRKAIEEVGYWEEFFIHYDDVDWCLRVQEKGYKIFCNPRSIVFHESMYRKQPTWIKYYNARNLLYLYAKHKASMFFFALLKFLSWTLYFFVHGYFRNSAMIAQGIWDFFRGKKGQGNFILENYIKLDSYDWNSLKTKDLDLVFSKFEALDEFLKMDLIERKNIKNLFIYQINKDEESKLGEIFSGVKIYPMRSFNLLSFIKMAFNQFIKLAFKKNSRVILDGAFEGFLIFPTFRKNLVVYPRFGTLVDLEISNK